MQVVQEGGIKNLNQNQNVCFLSESELVFIQLFLKCLPLGTDEIWNMS